MLCWFDVTFIKLSRMIDKVQMKEGCVGRNEESRTVIGVRKGGKKNSTQ